MEHQTTSSGLSQVALPGGQQIRCVQPREATLVYEQVEEYFLHDFSLPEGAVVFDVGANIGLFSLALLRRQPTLHIYAFEPIPLLFEALKHNAFRHGNGQIEVFACGLGGEDGFAEFAYFPNATTMSTAHPKGLKEEAIIGILENIDSLKSSLRFLRWVPGFIRPFVVRTIMDKLMEAQEVTCSMRSLSSMLRQEKISRVDLLKIDVEKAEVEVLSGLEDGHWPAIQQVIMEVHDMGGRLEQVCDVLKKRGLEVLSVEPAGLKGVAIFNVHAKRSESDVGAPLDNRQ
jgi:FkbM family methyltransferase